MECGFLTSLPGARAQTFHADTTPPSQRACEAQTIKVQLALVDVGSDMGPFEVGGVDVRSRVLGIAALPDGVHFVVGLGIGDNQGEVRLYHVDGTLVHAFEGHTGPAWSVAVTPDGQHIISGANDKRVKVWSIASKSLVSTCNGHTHPIEAVAAMPDGQRFLSGSSDETVRVWLLDGTLENTFELHAHNVLALVALPDNQHALSGFSDGTVKLFNVNDGGVLRTFKHHTHVVSSLALLPDGLRFVSSGTCDTAFVVELGLAPFV